MKKLKKIGIVGCGAIGGFLAKTIENDFKSLARLNGLCDIDQDKIGLLIKKIKRRIPILALDDLISKSDLIIEAASGKISPIICKKALEKNKDVMILSIGGLLNKHAIFSLAKMSRGKIILPSGAICGIDGLKSAGIGKIRSVTLSTYKPPRGLKGAPYLIKKGIDLESIVGEKLIFSGNTESAVKAFPKNINVSALLSIAGIGSKKTRVKIFTSPKFKKNIHEIKVEGEFGKFATRTENVPFPDNPKTSFLAALSAASTLKQILDEDLRIGT
ncbi:aspartate dehydrogenase [Candidatus Omnitrophota bacterium]